MSTQAAEPNYPSYQRPHAPQVQLSRLPASPLDIIAAIIENNGFTALSISWSGL
jgi:hypothetical protein